MPHKLESITKWLTESGLVVNEEKTELCLFHKSPQPLINITINNKQVKSKPAMNVLGITFDSMILMAQQFNGILQDKM